MNIAHIETQSFIYGPGCRFVIWVQGCSIHCKGCWNKEMWSFKPKITASVTDLMQMILSHQTVIEGVTILGGEPFDQYQEILELAEKIQSIDLSVMLFTGYEMPEIELNRQKKILHFTDILVSGRYEQDKRSLNHQWIGSTNQTISFLTKRYENYCLDNQNYVEISIDEQGSLSYLGFPSLELMEKIHDEDAIR